MCFSYKERGVLTLNYANMKKWLLLNVVLTGVLGCIFLTSGQSFVEMEMLHCYEDGFWGTYIVPNKYLVPNDITGGYSTEECPPGLYFSCVEQICTWPEDACPCVRGL